MALSAKDAAAVKAAAIQGLGNTAAAYHAGSSAVAAGGGVAADTPQAPTQSAPTQGAAPDPNANNNFASSNNAAQPPSAQDQKAETKALQDYLVQQGYLTAGQVATGPGVYGPQTTAAVAKLHNDLGVQAPTPQEITQSNPQQLAQKYQNIFSSVQNKGNVDSAGAAKSQIQSLMQQQNQPSTDPVFGAMSSSLGPIMDSLNQVLQNINNPALTAVSLQQEYNSLAQQNNLPGMQTQLLNMQNVMNGTEDDIRDEVSKTGGMATESQVLALTGARNKVILKQYNALSTQYQAAQTNVQNMMQYASQDQATQLQRQTATAGIVENMASIESQMMQMGMTMQQHATDNANKIVTNVGYSGLAAQAQGNPQALNYYERILGLAPNSLSDPSTLNQLETLRQISLGVTPTTPGAAPSGSSSSPISAAMSAIGQFESGGSYTAISPATASGDHSYGKYQVLGSNVPTWTKEVLGQSMTPQEFLQNPQAQDAVAQAKIGGYWNQYGNINDVSSMWFTGKPAAQSGGLKDVTGTTSAQYEQKVGDLFNQYSTQPYGAMGTPYTQPTNPSNPSPTSGGSLLSSTGLSIQAFNYLTQGVSSMSRLNVLQRNKIMTEATTWLNTNGIDVSTFQTRYTAYNQVLNGNIQRTNAAQIQENELQGTISNLSSTISQSDLGSLKAGNVAKLFAGQQVNDPTTTKYSTYLLSLRNELAGYNAAVRGNLSAAGGPSPDKTDLDDAANVIQNGISSGSLMGFQQAVTSQQQKMAVVLQGSVDNANKQVWSLFGVGDKYQSPAQQSMKGQMSDKDFVESTLTKAGLSYSKVISQIPSGQKGVINNSTGEVGYIPDSEFDPSKYTSL